MSNSTQNDPAQNLIVRTLLAPALIVVAMVVLFLPALGHAAPAGDTVFSDAPGDSVRRVEVRSVTVGDEVQVEFTVRVAPRDVPRLRAEWSADEGWESLELVAAGNGLFRGTVSLPAGADLDFFLLGADSAGQINDVRYGSLFAPVHVPSQR